MKMEQVFSESDLSELEQMLIKSKEPKNRVMRLWQNWMCFWLKHTKAMRYCALVCIILLCVFCTFFIVEREQLRLYKWMAFICAVTVVWCIHKFFTWDKRAEQIDNFLNPKKAVQKYREPFVVAVEENILHYRQSDFPISSIDHIIAYKCYLFIRANKRWCFIKAEEEEKAMLLSKLHGNSKITFTKIDEPVDLRQFR
ncbi:MAG: hypothetical protein K2N80_16400 [Lachnospiraceae bacterium]|nr:hypothetical protein [Lachnospiraceae bacterium]